LVLTIEHGKSTVPLASAKQGFAEFMDVSTPLGQTCLGIQGV